MRRGLVVASLTLVALLARPSGGDVPASAPGAAAAEGALTVTPERVPIGLLFDGATIDVRARVPAGWQAAVVLQSPAADLKLKRKGRRAGVLWMSVGEVTFHELPAVYHVLSTTPLGALAGGEELVRWRLGYEALVPGDRPEAALRGELVKMKSRSGFFALHPAELVDAGGGGAEAGAGRLLAGSFRLPAAAPPGDYQVRLVGFHDGHGVALGAARVHLETVGAVRALQTLATGHGLLYGVVAVVVAILVGLLTGLVFRPRAGDAH